MKNIFKKKNIVSQQPVEAVPQAVIVQPLVKLDASKINSVKDISALFSSMGIVMSHSAVAGSPVEKMFNMDSFVNNRAEKMAAITAVHHITVDDAVSMTDKEIDDLYHRICTDGNISRVVRR